MRAVSAKEDVASRRMPVGKHLHQLVLAIYEWVDGGEGVAPLPGVREQRVKHDLAQGGAVKMSGWRWRMS